MDRQDLMLAVLSTSGGKPWLPALVQKVLFLVDEKLTLGGKYWRGSFDPAVYRELEALEARGLAVIDRLVAMDGEGCSRSHRSYRLTQAGQTHGDGILAALSGHTREAIRTLATWLRGLSFEAMVAAK